MTYLDMCNQQCSLAFAQDSINSSFPALRRIPWCGCELSATVCANLAPACLLSLRSVQLSNRGTSAAGLCERVQAPWAINYLDVRINNLDTPALSKSS